MIRREKSARRFWGYFIGCFFTCLIASSSSFAHPMGNFSINHYSRITVKKDSIEIRYLIDLAEIPTFQEMQQGGFGADPQAAPTREYLAREAELLKKNLTLILEASPTSLQTQSTEVIFPAGAGGLSTMKMGFVYAAKLSANVQTTSLHYRDDNFPTRIGWKEIVASPGEGVTFLQASAAATDRSGELSNYPTDLLNSPPHDLEATVSFEVSGVEAGRGTSVASVLSDSKASVLSHPRAAVSHKRVEASKTNASTSQHVATDSSTAQGVEALLATGSSPSLLRANQQGTPKSKFTELMTAKPFSFWFLFMAAGIAAGLGALHALEPGHGKTIVAAYLVGSRGTARHAVLLGIVVTAAHTAGVYLLGALTLYASQYIVPEQLYPWLGAISGVTVAGLGIFILLKNLTGESMEHSHVDGKNHSHWFLSNLSAIKRAGLGTTFSRAENLYVGSDGPAEAVPFPKTLPSHSGELEPALLATGHDSNEVAAVQPEKVVSLRQLLALGVTGGIVPCPAALVVLLSAFSLHRIGFGLFLITSFSFGLALVLVIIGLTMVYAKRFVSRFTSSSPMLRYLPVLSSSFMVILGIGIAVSAFSPSLLTFSSISRDRLVPFVTIILLGLFLGMRHSTDPDHVVAVSTIVSRERSIKHSSMIGMLWGLGHSLTIFLVGSVIICFGVIIPPRLGLSMEFCVALMLILLGVLNLTGALRWITERFTPKKPTDNFSGSLQPSRETFLERTVGKLGLFQTLRPFVIGLVHGLAGSAAVALLVLSTIRSPLWATAYLLVFGAGTMLGMMIMTTAIAMPLAYTGKRFAGVNRYMTATSGVLSMAFGLFLVYQIGLVDGLFKAQAHWTPQ